MQTIGERIEHIKKQKGLSYRQLAEIIGDVTGDAIRKAINRNNVKEFYINKISDKLRINKEWILTGNGEMSNSTNINKEGENQIYIDVSDKKSLNLDEIAVIVAENEDELMKRKIFSNVIEVRVAKKIAEITTSVDSLKKYLDLK
jgi:transcriptional regulator with XRE-family HTH domain